MGKASAWMRYTEWPNVHAAARKPFFSRLMSLSVPIALTRSKGDRKGSRRRKPKESAL